MTTAENLMADEAIKSSIPSEYYVRSAFQGVSLGKGSNSAWLRHY